MAENLNFVLEPSSMAGDQLLDGDALLVKVVENFPVLYSKEHADYKLNNVRDAAWESVAEITNLHYTECIKRWGQLRDNFSRELRKREEEERSGSGKSNRKGFSLYNEMLFLKTHIQRRRVLHNISNPAPRRIPLHLGNSIVLPSLNPRYWLPAASQSNSGSLQIRNLPENIPLSAGNNSVQVNSIISVNSRDNIGSQNSSTCGEQVLRVDSSLTSAQDGIQILPLNLNDFQINVSQDKFPSSNTGTQDILSNDASNSQQNLNVPFSEEQVILQNQCEASTSEPPTTDFTSLMPPISSRCMTPNIGRADILINDAGHSRQNSSDPSYKAKFFNGSQKQYTKCDRPATNTSTESPSSCYNPKTMKNKKTDAVESSFLQLSATIQEHFSSKRQPESKEIENDYLPNDVSFGNLILSELSTMDAEKKTLKKQRILEVLYKAED